MPSFEESFLESLRQAVKNPALALDQALKDPNVQALMESLQRHLAPAPTFGETQRETEKANSPERVFPTLSPSASRALIMAALADTFEMAEVEPSEEERAALIKASDLVMIDGQRRLRLTEAARAEIISEAKGGDLYGSLLKLAREQDRSAWEGIRNDRIRLPSAWLRGFLSDEFGGLASLPTLALQAALAARERLRLVQLSSKVPSIEELANRAGFEELLEPLRVLIGADGQWDGTRRDHFVGREKELTELRAFVDELKSKGIVEWASRAKSRATSAVLGQEQAGLMIIEAPGGMGKSALVAKFVLDHALDQARRFPFAYLDFDRATLDPERPHQLLLEITRQVTLQYPEAQRELAPLAAQLRTSLTPSALGDNPSESAISDPFAQFVSIVRTHATFGERAFLLVLDTLEVVQWTPSAIERLAGFIEEFRRKGMDELRVVACGRADIPEFREARGGRVPAIHRRLKPLGSKEAYEMADVLGRRSLRDAWQSSWSNAIATGKMEKESSVTAALRGLIGTPEKTRREPLSVRVAVDYVVRSEDKAKAIQQIAEVGAEAADDFVARLYERRILNHVRSTPAGKLAWPGLVIRRLTVEIVREVLAPLCKMSPDEAENAFFALGQEIWMVTREGDALRHRPDLRARTLPLMREKNQQTFATVAESAVNYFARHRQRSPEDEVEWLYHSLLAGVDPRTLEASLTPKALSALARAVDDFSPDSLAASYLASRTAQRRLPPSKINQMRPWDALYHLQMTSQSVFSMDDTSLDRPALKVADRLVGEPRTRVDTWVRTLWIKTGAWEPLGGVTEAEEWIRTLRSEVDASDSLQELVESHPAPLRTHLFWLARIAPSMDRAELAGMARESERIVTEIRRGTRQPGFRAWAQALLLARLAQPEASAFEGLDRRLAEILVRMKSNPAPSTQAALRDVMIFGERSRGKALELWLAGRRHGENERVRTPTVSEAELRALRWAETRTGIQPADKTLADLERPRRYTDERTVLHAARTLSQLLESVESADAAREMGRDLSVFFAARSEDWVVPFGYAAARAIPRKLPRVLVERLLSYSPDDTKESVADPGAGLDMLVAMRTADEASDLTGFAQLVRQNAQESTAELDLLIDHHRRWNATIGQLLALDNLSPNAPPAAPEPPSPRPAPGPIIHRDDLQKDRWGGKSERDGRAVRAALESVERGIFFFSLIVESTDGSKLEPPVVFHLHDSFPRSIITIRRIGKENTAKLADCSAYGVFAIGIQVLNARREWVSLEFDLASLRGLPRQFLSR